MVLYRFVVGIVDRCVSIFGRLLEVVLIQIVSRISLLLFVFVAGVTNSQGNAYGSQALVRLSGNRVAIDVYINNQGPFPFLFDTATSHTIVTPALRDRLRLKPSPGGAVEVVTGAGSEQSHFYRIGDFANSGVIVEGLNVVVLPLSETLEIAGVLGSDFIPALCLY